MAYINVDDFISSGTLEWPANQIVRCHRSYLVSANIARQKTEEEKKMQRKVLVVVVVVGNYNDKLNCRT